MTVASHHRDCDWHCDQYDFECTCGATAPRAAFFDEHVAKADAIRAGAVSAAASEEQIRISPWMPDTNPMNLAVLGKAVEEGGEVTTACGRCIVQGIEESEPVSLKPNRLMLSEEIADSFATNGWLIDHFGLDRAWIEARATAKRGGFNRWLDLIRGMLAAGEA